MKVYLLDTNHCSLIINKNPQILSRLTSLNRNDLLTTNVIVCGELMYMAQNSEYKEKNLPSVRSFIDNIHIYSIEQETVNIYAEIKAKIFNKYAPKEKKLRRKLRIENLGFTDHDIWIAATGVCHNAIIISSDSDFPRMLEIISLKLENWTT